MPTSFHFLELLLFSEFQGRIKIRRKTKTDIDLCDALFFHTWQAMQTSVFIFPCVPFLSVASYSGQQLIAVVTHFLFHYPRLTMILNLLLIHFEAWEFERAIFSKVPS